MATKLSPLHKALKPVFSVTLDPRITGPVLLALLLVPDKLRDLLPPQALSYLTSPAVIRTLGLIVGLSAVRKVNAALSRSWLNNGKPDAKFEPGKEIVLVTGGSSGIGELVARKFAALGSSVVVMDVNPPSAPLPSGITFYKVDVTSTSEIAAAAAKIRESVGEPTVLINNAGMGTVSTILGGAEARIRKTFEVNTMAHFWMVREFAPAMIKANRGHIVTIASLASFVVHAGNTDYCCTKASALAFHEGLASELKHRYNAPDVKTTIVHPIWVDTPLIKQLTSSPQFNDIVLEPEFVADAIVNQVLLGRSAQLVLPEAMSFLTGVRGWPSWLQEAVRNKVGYQLEFLQR